MSRIRFLRGDQADSDCTPADEINKPLLITETGGGETSTATIPTQTMGSMEMAFTMAAGDPGSEDLPPASQFTASIDINSIGSNLEVSVRFRALSAVCNQMGFADMGEAVFTTAGLHVATAAWNPPSLVDRYQVLIIVSNNGGHADPAQDLVLTTNTGSVFLEIPDRPNTVFISGVMGGDSHMNAGARLTIRPGGISVGGGSVEGAGRTILRPTAASFGSSDSKGIVTPAKQLFVSQSGLVFWEQWDREDVTAAQGTGLFFRNGWNLLNISNDAARIVNRQYVAIQNAQFTNNVINRGNPLLSRPFTNAIEVQSEAIAQINCQLPSSFPAPAVGIWLRTDGAISQPLDGIRAQVSIDGAGDGKWNSFGNSTLLPPVWDATTPTDAGIVSGSPIALRLVVFQFNEAGRFGGKTYGNPAISSLQDLSQDLTFQTSGTFAIPGDVISNNNITRISVATRSLADDFFVCGRHLMFSDLPTSHSVQVEGRTAVFETAGDASMSVDSWNLPIQVSMSLLSASTEIATLPANSEVWGGSTITFGFGPTDLFGVASANSYGSSFSQGRGALRINVTGESHGQSSAVATGSRKTAVFNQAFSHGDSSDIGTLGLRFQFEGGESFGQSVVEATGRKTATLKEAIIQGGSLTEAMGVKRIAINNAQSHGGSWVSRGVFNIAFQLTAQVHGTSHTSARGQTLLQLSSDGAASYGQAISNARIGLRIPFGQQLPASFGDSRVEGTFLKTAAFKEGSIHGDSQYFATGKVRLVFGTSQIHGDSAMFNAIRMGIIRDPLQVAGQSIGSAQLEVATLGFRYVIVEPAGGFNAPVCVFLDADAPICIMLPDEQVIPITVETLERIGITLDDLKRVSITIEDSTVDIQLPKSPLGDE